MKKIILFPLISFAFSLASFCQSNTKKLLHGVWTEKANGTTEIKWTFHSKGVFNNVSFWSNPIQLGGTYRVGKFTFDENANKLSLNFQNTFIATNEKVETHVSQDTKEWEIKSISENEMIIKRPVIRESEKKYKSFDGNTVEIRLIKISSQIQDPENLPQTTKK